MVPDGGIPDDAAVLHALATLSVHRLCALPVAVCAAQKRHYVGTIYAVTCIVA